MNDHPRFTDTLPPGLPDAATLIAELRAADDTERAAIIARYPALGTLAPVPVFAEWLGMRVQSIYAGRNAKRADGQLGWPAEDETIIGRKMWRFATIALHRASVPGRGWNLRSDAKEGCSK